MAGYLFSAVLAMTGSGWPHLCLLLSWRMFQESGARTTLLNLFQERERESWLGNNCGKFINRKSCLGATSSHNMAAIHHQKMVFLDLKPRSLAN